MAGSGEVNELVGEWVGSLTCVDAVAGGVV